MTTYNYIKKDGTLGTITAASSSAALASLPPDASPTSGIMEAKGAPTTSAPSPEPTKTREKKEKLPSLPSLSDEKPKKPGNVLAFASALNQAVKAAQENRNKIAGNLMGGYSGTLAASDFNGVLGGLNRSSDNLVNTVVEEYGKQRELDQAALTPEISVYTDDDGNLRGIDKNTGEVKWTQEGAGKGSDKGLMSGGLSLGTEDLNDMYTILQTGKTAQGTQYGNPRGADGYVDPRTWLQLFDLWKQGGGIDTDFLKKFPISNINPANTWIKAELMARGLADEWQSYVSAGSGDFTPTEKRKLEQAGLLNASRQQQLNYLYGKNNEDDYEGLF